MAGFGFQVAKGFVDVVTKVDKKNVRREADGIVRDINGRLHDSEGRFLASGFLAGKGFSSGFGKGATTDDHRSLFSRVLGKSMRFAGKAAGKVFGLGFKVAAMAALANTASSIIAPLLPAIAQVAGGLGALLPAAAFTGALAMVTFKMALSGVGDALSAGLKGDTEGLAKAMESMSPAGQKAVKAILTLKPQLDKLKQTVQQNFFAPFVNGLKPLLSTYFPQLSAQLTVTSSDFGNMVAGIMKVLQTPAVVDSLSFSLMNAGDAIHNVAAGVPGLVAGFVPLIEVGSSFLPQLTAGFSGLTSKFAAFMTQAAASGQLKTFIQGALDMMKQLFTFLGQVGSIFSSIFGAMQASGGNLLGTIGTLVGQFAAFLKTAQGAQMLQSIFGVLAQAGQLFGQAFALILPIVAQLVTVLAGPFSAVLAIASNLLSALAPTIEMVGNVLTSALAVVLPVITDLLAVLMPVVAQLASVLVSALAPVIGVVAQVFATLVPILTPIIMMLVNALMPIITALSPVITVLAAVIGQILGTALQAIMPLFQTLLPVIAQLVTTLLPALIPIIQLIGSLFQALMPAIMPVISLLADNAAKTLQMITPLLTFVAQAIAFLITKLIALIGPIVSAIGWVANFFNKMNEMGAIKAMFVGALNAIRSGVSTAIGWVKSYIVANINAVKSTFLGIVSIVSTVIGFFAKIQAGIAAKIASMIAAVKAIPGKIKSALGNLGNLLLNAGKQIIQGLISGVTGMIGKLKDKFSSITNMIPDWKGPMTVDMRLLEPSGKALMGGLMTGVAKQVPALQGQLQGITAGIPNMVGGTTPQPGMAASMGAVTIQQLVVQINTPLNLKTKDEKRKFAGEIFDAVESYKKEYR